MPLPIMQLMTRAVIVQRPIDRTKVIVRLTSWGRVYHGTTLRLQRNSMQALARIRLPVEVVPESFRYAL